MARFAYEARDNSGRLVSGELVADSTADVSRMLRAESKFVVNVRQTSRTDEPLDQIDVASAARHVKRDDVIDFAHQLAVMVDTGVSIGEALDSIREQSHSEHFKAIIDDVTDGVQSGLSFSAALARHPRVFPPLMVSLVKASEASGTMGAMLDRISAYLTKERHTIKTIRGAMTYPVVMVLISIAVTVFLLTFVLPRFAGIYTNRGAVLPMPTRILMAAAHVFTNYWYLFAGAAVAAITMFFVMRTQEWGRRTIDTFKIKCPVIGPMFTQLYITRAMRTMGTMLGAGVPMLDMIAISRGVTNNALFRDLWDEVDEQIQHGAQLSSSLAGSSLIPGSVTRMIQSGEKSGRLGQVMERVAEFTETDFDRTVKRTTEFIEPAMIVFMGSFIGFVAISLLLPIFSIGRVMAGG